MIFKLIFNYQVSCGVITRNTQVVFERAEVITVQVGTIKSASTLELSGVQFGLIAYACMISKMNEHTQLVKLLFKTKICTTFNFQLPISYVYFFMTQIYILFLFVSFFYNFFSICSLPYENSFSQNIYKSNTLQ